MRLTLILTKPPSFSSILNTCMKLALLAVSNNHEIGVYLIGDGVFCAKVGQMTAENLGKLVLYGGNVFVCKEDLEARGLVKNDLIPGAEILSNIFECLVDDVMEKSQRVICF